MFEVDKQKFGAFVAALRKEKELTQKEVARQLFVSDKAVSKWERGMSLPDIALLIPLADLLGVTVTELLEGRRIAPAQQMDAGQVETLVKRAICMSGQEEACRGDRQARLRRTALFLFLAAVSGAELAVLYLLGHTKEQLIGNLLLSEWFGLSFGLYFFVFVKEKLPAYYDENKISYYTDGPVRIHMAGLAFHNGNWTRIVGVIRVWAACLLTVAPLMYLLLSHLFPAVWQYAGMFITMAFVLGGLFIPVYVVGKKYE